MAVLTSNWKYISHQIEGEFSSEAIGTSAGNYFVQRFGEDFGESFPWKGRLTEQIAGGKIPFVQRNVKGL